MSSVCISNCVKDTVNPVPLRATYINLYKWPESDAEFVRSVSKHRGGHQHQQQQPRVVDSVSCRQLYLRSYTFSRKETVPERTRKCIGRVREKVSRGGRKRKAGFGRKRKCVGLRRVQELTCATLCKMFRRLLSCTATVDVVDDR